MENLSEINIEKYLEKLIFITAERILHRESNIIIGTVQTSENGSCFKSYTKVEYVDNNIKSKFAYEKIMVHKCINDCDNCIYNGFEDYEEIQWNKMASA